MEDAKRCSLGFWESIHQTETDSGKEGQEEERREKEKEKRRNPENV